MLSKKLLTISVCILSLVVMVGFVAVANAEQVLEMTGENEVGRVSFGCEVGTNMKQFQTFKAIGEELFKVEIKMRTYEPNCQCGNLPVMQLYEVENKWGEIVPTGEPLASVTIELPPDFSHVAQVVEFPLEYSGLTVGKEYAIVLTQREIIVEHGYMWIVTDGDIDGVSYGKGTDGDWYTFRSPLWIPRGLRWMRLHFR